VTENDAHTHAAVTGCAQTVTQLETALARRTTISEAVGMLKERYQLDSEQSFALLVRLSSTSNVKVYDLARELGTTGHVGNL
jgi:AmiR/NasT family two-component response regulator